VSDAAISSIMNISGKLKTVLPKEILSLVKMIDKIAYEHSSNAFLVGGFVRDALLGRKNLDLDVVIERNTKEVVEALVNKVGGSYVFYKRFGTATAILPCKIKLRQSRLDEIKVDFATARKEIYERPAALPTVEFSTLKDDLSRRDFTINAMALSIGKDSFGEIIDFFGGQKDLANKRIRVLHDASFIDDPTRIFRAVRFEQRLGFKISSRTEALIKEAVKRKMFDQTQKQRLRDELIIILNEDEPKKMFRRMEELGELRFISPRLHFTKKTENLFDAVRESVSWFNLSYLKRRGVDIWIMYLNALLDMLSTQELEELCSAFVFKKGEQTRLFSYKRNGAKILNLLSRKGRISASEIYERLEPLSYEVILSMMAKSSSRIAKKRIADFFTRYNGTRLKIKGRDLEALGLKAGPGFKKILTEALHAKLNNGFTTKKQELSFVKGLIKNGSRRIKG